MKVDLGWDVADRNEQLNKTDEIGRERWNRLKCFSEQLAWCTRLDRCVVIVDDMGSAYCYGRDDDGTASRLGRKIEKGGNRIKFEKDSTR